jgi:alpha-L-rhamnosidase
MKNCILAILSCVFLAPAAAAAESTPTVNDLRCEYLVDPLGIDIPQPRLSWMLQSSERGQRQTAYRVIVASSTQLLDAETPDLWDSGQVASNASTQLEYAGKPLQSRQRCFWKVRVWDRDGQPTEWSKTAVWEMGLIEPGDWKARWIGDSRVAESQIPETEEIFPAPHFRKSFTLAGPIKKGRAYICGLGYFDLYINGQKVSDDVLVPNQTDYDERTPKKLLYPFDAKTRKRQFYLTYDISSMLREGENVVGVILGNGWYNQRGRAVEGQLWYGPPKTICQLEIDGKIVGSGEDWKFHGGPIVFDHLFNGETYDARLEMPGWSAPGFDDSAWKPAFAAKAASGRLSSQLAPTDRATVTLQPKKITLLEGEPKRYLVDFGQNFAGWVRLKPRGPAGAQVKVEFAEQIDDQGKKIPLPDENPTAATYILKGGEREEYEPRFTWFAFRYAFVSGWPGELTADDIEGRHVHTNVDSAAIFKCSNDLFNRIHQNYLWTQRNNIHGGVPMDCPHRERLGYTGDGHASAETAMLNFDMARFYTKWIEDMGDAQDRDRENGYVPHTAPFQGGAGGVGWGSAYVIVPWQVYRHYGDVRILREHFDGMKRWVDYLAKWERDGIVMKDRPGSWNLADWLCAGESPPKELVHTYYYAATAEIVARTAELLGKSEDRRRYAEIHDRARKAFLAKFLDEKNLRFHDGQCGADVFGLSLGGLPDEKKSAVAEAFTRRILEDKKGHLDTGFLGTTLLFDLLNELGRNDVSFTIMNQRTYPSFGFSIENGATTIWEAWNGGGSRNHPAFGGGVKWLYKNLAGLQLDPGSPGFEHAIVAPSPVGEVTRCYYRLKTMRGTFGVEWQKSENRFTLDILIPPNSTATVFVPAKRLDEVTESDRPIENAAGVKFLRLEAGRAVFEIQSGNYRFASNG